MERWRNDMATTREENDILTRIGRGTPAGEMLRRYWWPVGFAEEVKSGGVPVPARLLGEDLILFRDGQGHLPSLHASGYPQWALSRPEVRWEQTWFGIQATSKIQGENEEKISLYLFPSNNRFTSARTYGEPGHHLGFRVPVDDEETITFSVAWYPDSDWKASGLTTHGLKRSAWGVYTPIDNGWWRVVEEDRMAAEQQGRITDRTGE